MTMSSFRVRPKFEMESNKTIEEIITIIKEKLKINTHHLHGQAILSDVTVLPMIMPANMTRKKANTVNCGLM